MGAEHPKLHIDGNSAAMLHNPVPHVHGRQISYALTDCPCTVLYAEQALIPIVEPEVHDCAEQTSILTIGIVHAVRKRASRGIEQKRKDSRGGIFEGNGRLETLCELLDGAEGVIVRHAC